MNSTTKNKNDMKQSELLQSQTNAEKQESSLDFSKPDFSKNEEMWTREQIENTPFIIAGNDERGYVGIMGKYAIAPNHPTKEGVRDYIKNHHWELVLTLATIAFTQLQHEQALSKQIPKQNIRSQEEVKRNEYLKGYADGGYCDSKKDTTEV